MTNAKEAETDFSKAVARCENEVGVPGPVDSYTNWLVPPILIPALLVALIIARFAYVAYS